MTSEAQPRVDLYDTTLRDGTQREGLSLAVDDKLRIARRLDALGMTFIEGGWPGSNPKDAEFFRRARDIDWRTSAVTAFGATRKAGTRAEDDANLRALLDAGTKVTTLVGKTSSFHVTEVLRTTLDENLRMIEESLAFLAAEKRRVDYDAEHFFDGFTLDASYALETLRAAVRGGAEVLVLCDTNGGSLPWRIDEVVRQVRATIDRPLGVHVHNDTGCAVANSLAAVRAGAVHVQGTINGYGERCGNADLVTIAADLALKMGFQVLREGAQKEAIRELSEISRFVAEVANLAPDDHAPYVGRNAFAHKGGLHVSAMQRNALSYNHVDPTVVGNTTRVVVSELSGRATVKAKIEELNLVIDDEVAAKVLEQVKASEARGFSYDAADASIALLTRRLSPGYVPLFEIVDYKVIVRHDPRFRAAEEAVSEATIKVRVAGEIHHTVAEGEGPVGALDAALRKALRQDFPEIARIHLEDFKVRILDGAKGTSSGTAAVTRVLIDSGDGERRWSTVGASQNIIEASCLALIDSIEYGLSNNRSADSMRPPRVDTARAEVREEAS